MADDRDIDIYGEKGAEREKEREGEREKARVAKKRRHFANLLADLATLLGEFSVHVRARGQLRERRLFGLLEAEGEHENGENQHDTHGDRVYVLRVLQQQTDVVHGGGQRACDVTAELYCTRNTGTISRTLTVMIATMTSTWTKQTRRDAQTNRPATRQALYRMRGELTSDVCQLSAHRPLTRL